MYVDQRTCSLSKQWYQQLFSVCGCLVSSQKGHQSGHHWGWVRTHRGPGSPQDDIPSQKWTQCENLHSRVFGVSMYDYKPTPGNMWSIEKFLNYNQPICAFFFLNKWPYKYLGVFKDNIWKSYSCSVYAYVFIINILISLCVLSCFSSVWACQAPLSMGFSRQEYYSGLPCPPPGDLPDPGIEPESLMSPALVSRFFTTSALIATTYFFNQLEPPPTDVSEELTAHG